MTGRCELFLSNGSRCRGSVLARCAEDGAAFCAAHRGFRRGVPTADWCAACEGATPEARREAQHRAIDGRDGAIKTSESKLRAAFDRFNALSETRRISRARRADCPIFVVIMILRHAEMPSGSPWILAATGKPEGSGASKNASG